MTDSPSDVTDTLLLWRNGDPEALNRLMPLVYGELRRLAASYVKREYRYQTLQTTARSGPPAHLAAGKAAEEAHIAARGLAPNTEGVWRPTLEQMQSAAFKVIVGEGKFTAGGLPTGVKLDALATEIKHGSSALSSSYQLRLMVYRAVTRGEQLVIETQRPLNPTFRAWLERWGVQINQIP